VTTMKPNAIGLAGIFGITLILQALGQTPPIESQFMATQSGPVGQVGVAAHEGWNGTATNVFVEFGSGSLDGTLLGLVASAGDKAEIRGGTGYVHSHYCLFATERAYPPSTGTKLYFSFLYRFNSTSGLDPQGKVIAVVTRQNGSSPTNFSIQARLSGNYIQLGIAKSNGIPVWVPKNIAVGETVFVVARQQMIGATRSDDIVDLWVNPPPSTFGKSEDEIPTPDASTSEGYEDGSSAGPGRFYLDVWPGANATFDEFRFSTNWADVTPPVGTCVKATIDSTLPTDNPTISEGALTMLSVSSRGTARVHSWQESRDNGITWVNASGGIGSYASKYFTPLLSLADNGIKYRCLVNVPCNNSWATSSIITVTVTQAVKTPTGLVLDERWQDYEWGDTVPGYPVNTTNAAWLYSSGTGRYLNGIWDDENQTTRYNLVLEPPQTSSMLVLAFFTDQDAPPIHLDVGKGLVTEFVFQANGIAESNGGLRLGLFNYADGATRPTASGFSGSSGNGTMVNGFMVNIDFGKVFSINSPIGLYYRAALDSANLMGTLGDFVSITAGPADLLGAPAFQEGVFYTNRLTISRIAKNMVRITNSIIGGGTNWTVVGVETNFPFHRFDAFAIRVASAQSSASQFIVSNLYIAVIDLPVEPPAPVPLHLQRQGDNVVLRWTEPRFSLYTATNLLGPYTRITNATSPYTNRIDSQTRFFRLMWTPLDQ